MDFIVSEFTNLIKRCSNGLALEKEVWRRGIELQCQTFARALEIYDAEKARQYAGKQKVLRIDRRTVLCMFGTVTFSRRLVRREGGKPFSILWIISWACHLIKGRCGGTSVPGGDWSEAD